MSRKDSQQCLSRPPLVTHYVHACDEVFGCYPFVAKKLFPKFEVVEAELDDAGFSSMDYAYTVVTMMEKFARDKGFKCLPVNVFLGPYCMKRYRKVAESATVRITRVSEADIILSDELLVATAFIDRNKKSDKFVRMSVIVEELKPLLSREWMDAYARGCRRPELDVVETLASNYRIRRPVASYLDIVSALR